ncbi:MAG: DegT/DnrJ/EryC1/StrS aminotransferase family protein [Nitrospirae bacterium]|nr:DegT/DnrJ/EryC1/StrS aminotransferase family protein [Nitrospirota bacterium]
MIRDNFLPLSRPSVDEDGIAAVAEVLRSGWWTTGPVVDRFERMVADYLRHDGNEIHSVALNSCTAGLHLALLALGIGKGDEVIVPTWTFAATAQIVEWTGATLVLCDIEEDSLNIDIQKAERLINSRTKAIIPVHMAGYPCDMDGLKKIGADRGIKIVEDAAHAIGTQYRGTKIGNFSDATVFSFYATKNLATGEGGMVVSSDEELIGKIRKLSYFGIYKEAFNRYGKTGKWFYDIEELGYKYNFDSIHAAIGLAQLHKIDVMNNRRKHIAKVYRNNLSSNVLFTADSEIHNHIYHLFIVRVPSSIIERDSLIDKLKQRNIGASVHFRPLHMHSYYRGRFPEDNFPVANKVFPEMLSIPMFPSMTDEDIEYVVEHFNDLVRK